LVLRLSVRITITEQRRREGQQVAKLPRPACPFFGIAGGKLTFPSISADFLFFVFLFLILDFKGTILFLFLKPEI